MTRRWHAAGRTAVWLLALLVAVVSARYFLVPPPLLVPPRSLLPAAMQQGAAAEAIVSIAPYLYSEYPVWLLVHVGCGIIALTLGLFQFVASMRSAHPERHRAMGRFYLSAVLVGGVTGFPLSFLALGAFPDFLRPHFFPGAAGFASLSVVWVFVSAVAFSRARRRRFNEHRAWMLRSYCLTFSAVTIRLVAPLLLLLTGDPLISFSGGILSWPLNLVAAEWLIRRAPQPAVAAD